MKFRGGNPLMNALSSMTKKEEPKADKPVNTESERFARLSTIAKDIETVQAAVASLEKDIKSKQEELAKLNDEKLKLASNTTGGSRRHKKKKRRATRKR